MMCYYMLRLFGHFGGFEWSFESSCGEIENRLWQELATTQTRQEKMIRSVAFFYISVFSRCCSVPSFSVYMSCKRQSEIDWPYTGGKSSCLAKDWRTTYYHRCLQRRVLDSVSKSCPVGERDKISLRVWESCPHWRPQAGGKVVWRKTGTEGLPMTAAFTTYFGSACMQLGSDHEISR